MKHVAQLVYLASPIDSQRCVLYENILNMASLVEIVAKEGRKGVTLKGARRQLIIFWRPPRVCTNLRERKRARRAGALSKATSWKPISLMKSLARTVLFFVQTCTAG